MLDSGIHDGWDSSYPRLSTPFLELFPTILIGVMWQMGTLTDGAAPWTTESNREPFDRSHTILKQPYWQITFSSYRPREKRENPFLIKGYIWQGTDWLTDISITDSNYCLAPTILSIAGPAAL